MRKSIILQFSKLRYRNRFNNKYIRHLLTGLSNNEHQKEPATSLISAKKCASLT